MSEPSEDRPSSGQATPADRPKATTPSPAVWAVIGALITALFSCFSASLTATVPEIGQTIRMFILQPAPTTASPTAPYSSVPPVSGSRQPAPSAHILIPLFTDGPVPVQTKVIVHYDSIPADRYLWVVVRIPKVKPNWLVYPQLLEGIPKPVTGTANFETIVELGSVDEDVEEPFNIVVFLLDEEANRSFIEYSRKCISSQKECTGIELPASGAEILDFTTVMRK